MTKKQYILPVTEIVQFNTERLMEFDSISNKGGYGAAPALPHKSAGAVSAF